ncbi:MAG: hypothetical protein JW849_01295 [Phycisphaerae bacterium]|nr:hypothetical protein [Phycisphaerae bacterium]
MKRIIKKVTLSIFYLYLFSFGPAFLYCNWRYVKDHGFRNWIFFGEFVATAKSLIWPYYAVVGFGTRDSGTELTDIHFVNSRRSSHEALKIINQSDGVIKLSPNDKSVVTQLLQKSVIEAELVDDSYLKQVHPEFLHQFRDEYTRSLQDLVDGIQTNDDDKMTSAAIKYNIFSDWVSTHAKEIKFP